MLLPILPKTMHEALPATRKWWPKWDKSTKLNCLLTCIGTFQLTDRIRKRVEKWDFEPPECDQKYVIEHQEVESGLSWKEQRGCA